MERNKGITLISLVVTIIILIILAGISINMILGENGILTMAKKAKENMELAMAEEQEKLEELEKQMSDKTMWNSPFQYQLIGSTEQEKIEQKLGRKLEATDLFYEIEDKYNKEETYIYHKKEDVLIKVDKSKLKRSNGIWFWRHEKDSEKYEYYINQQKREELLDFLKQEGITELYISYSDKEFEEVELIKQVNREAYERGMVVEYLVGDSSYIKEDKYQKEIEDRIQKVVNYNKTCNYNEKIRGIHYDVEVHTSQEIEGLPNWKNSNSEEEKNSQRKINYIKFVERAYQVAKKENLTIAFDVPPLTYAANTVNYNGVEKSIMEYVVQNSDYISCMAYRNEAVDLYRYICLPSNTEYMEDTGRLAYTTNTKTFSDGTYRNTDSIHELAIKHKKSIMIGVEIGEAGEKNEFYDLGRIEMKRILTEFEQLLSKAEKDIVVGERSLKTQSIEKCGYTNIDFDHYGFMYHSQLEFFNMPD